MSKIPSPSNPYRETYNELQRVMVSNRFIFTQSAICLAIAIVLGITPFAVYLAAGSVLIILSLAFEKPYQLLRRLLPYGNWSPHLPTLPLRVKVLSLIMAIVMIISYTAMLFVLHRWILPLIVPSTTDDCWGSLACLLLKSILR
jgi:hypothetical protein